MLTWTRWWPKCDRHCGGFGNAATEREWHLAPSANLLRLVSDRCLDCLLPANFREHMKKADRPATLSPKKKNTDGIVLLCLPPASFLTFGKVNPGPPQTGIFFFGGRGGPSPPLPSFLSAPAPPQTDIFWEPPSSSPPSAPALFLT